jgi:hypothetical protein
MKKSELKKMIKEEISKSNLDEKIWRDGKMYQNQSEFDERTPARIEEFLDKLEDLVDEYHAELYLKDGVFTGMEAMKSASLGPDTAKNPE